MELSEKTYIKEPYIKAHVLENRRWYKDYLLVLVVIALGAVFSVINPKFISIINIFTILRNFSIMGFLALGFTIVIVLGGFDLSAGAIANFSAVISITLLMNGITNLALVWTISIIVGVVLSCLNGLVVIYIKVPSFIATLGMATLLRGFSRSLTGGGVTTFPKSLPAGFTVLGQYDVGGLIPVSAIIYVIAAVILLIVIEYSTFGRKMYAVGANPDAAKHVGIQINKVSFLCFLIAGLLYGIAGIIISSMFAHVTCEIGLPFQFPALISAILGISFLSSGFANVKGTLISVILLTILINGFSMINAPFYIRDIVQGVVLIIAIGALNTVKAKKITLKELIKDEKKETDA